MNILKIKKSCEIFGKKFFLIFFSKPSIDLLISLQINSEPESLIKASKMTHQRLELFEKEYHV